jgi:hypothetical protein
MFLWRQNGQFTNLHNPITKYEIGDFFGEKAAGFCPRISLSLLSLARRIKCKRVAKLPDFSFSL